MAKTCPITFDDELKGNSDQLFSGAPHLYLRGGAAPTPLPKGLPFGILFGEGCLIEKSSMITTAMTEKVFSVIFDDELNTIEYKARFQKFNGIVQWFPYLLNFLLMTMIYQDPKLSRFVFFVQKSFLLSNLYM